jgi:hypothetical protein
MKKSEFTQLTQIIEHIVRKEVRKQLPGIIAETFKSINSNKQIVAENKTTQIVEEVLEDPENESINLKTSLREMFAGTSVMGDPEIQPSQPKKMRQFTKNPILNQILNETTPDLRMREGMVGMAAMAGGYQAALGPMVGDGSVMAEGESSEPSFMRNVPTPTVNPSHIQMTPPVSQQQLMSESHIPMSTIPEGVSVLDVARQVPMAAPVAKALTKNYSAMMKLIDKKAGKI